MEGYYTHEVAGRKIPFATELFPPDIVQRIKEFDVRSDDIIIAGYPKTGTMWTSEMLWQIYNDEEPQHHIIKRVPFIEMLAMPPAGVHEKFIDILERAPSPRLIKTHLCPELFRDDLLETGAKVIVVTRNPKDTLVSFFHFHSLVPEFHFSGTWDDFFAKFVEQQMCFGDFFDFYQAWWKYHTHPNVMFLSYEDLKIDHKKCVQRMADFVNIEITEERLGQILDSTSKQSMTKDKKLQGLTTNKGQFIRKGIVGDWKSLFTQDQSEIVDKLYREKLANKGLHMEFEL